jgi:hypothetical protein
MEEYLMEEYYELFERGLLSEVDSEVDIDDIWPKDHDGLGDQERGATVKPVKIVNSKVLNYLGTVKESKTYNSRAWLLQSMLNVLGYPLTADGKFGKLTKQAVERFQADNGLEVDGIVGPASWTRIIYLGRKRISNSIIQEQDYENAANALGVEVEVVKAIKDVESSGSGYVFSNHPKILFEGHVFWKQLKNIHIEPSNHKDSDILYSTWTKDHYKGDVAEYVRLQKARQININAANASASWGLFQIMGNNYKLCGCDSISDFVKRMCMSESEQLMLFVEYIKKRKLHQYLKPDHTGNIPWAEFARRYNGAGYEKNKYHIKLKEAYEKYKKQKK